jgi:CDP-diacylglycerol---glycerol-3-phosphate 3-phosphatidyltransferase
MQNIPAILQRRWGVAALLFGLSLGLGYFFIQNTRWLAIASVVAIFELGLLYSNLKFNHRPHETSLLPALGMGNSLTLFRGLLLAWLAGFMFSPWPAGELAFLPFFLYLLAALTDGIDGYVARRSDHVTKLGQILDIEFDALGILFATAVAVSFGQLPWLFLILGLARYLFVGGIWWRNRHHQAVFDLPFSVTRRLLAGYQMGFLAVILWPGVHPPGTTLAGVIFAIPFLAIFARDWLIASGRINPTSPTYLTIRRKLVIILTYRLPVLLRLVVAIATMNLVIPAIFPVPDSLSLSDLSLFSVFIIGLAFFSMLLILLGFAGRLASLGLVGVAAVFAADRPLDIAAGLMLASTIAVMLLGTGAFSLWKPEDRFLNRRAGEN